MVPDSDVLVALHPKLQTSLGFTSFQSPTASLWFHLKFLSNRCCSLTTIPIPSASTVSAELRIHNIRGEAQFKSKHTHAYNFETTL